MNRQEKAEFNRRNIAEFRASGGRIASFGEAPVLLLTTTGARSGLPRTSPVMYLADEHDPDRVYVFASAAGADTNPAWFHNVKAHPTGVTVELGPRTFTTDAEALPDPDRGEIYAEQARRYPGFTALQAKTSRPIPVIALTLDRQRR